jgi:nucleotide-binding universal stress UspA family protein
VSTIKADSPIDGFERLAGNRADLVVVLGSTHRAGFRRVFPGSIAERLLQNGRCAVAIAPRGFAGRREQQVSDGAPADPGPVRDELRVIAVGFNGRPESRAALEAAAYLGMRAGATLRVIAVGQTLDPERRLSQPLPKVAKGLQDQLAAAVRDLPTELRALPVFERGAPTAVLWDKAQQGVDLLVIGSAGQGPLLRAWLTDPGTALMRSAPCPILLTPEPLTA